MRLQVSWVNRADPKPRSRGFQGFGSWKAVRRFCTSLVGDVRVSVYDFVADQNYHGSAEDFAEGRKGGK